MLDTTGQSGLDISNVTLTGSFTVETWIWFRPGEQITNKDGLLRTENGGAHINFYNGQLRFASYMTGEPRGDVVVGATQLGTGSWHHVAVTRDENDILRAYVDGVLDGTATEAWTADLVVDQITQTKRGTTDGAFDEFRIWDRELDAAELTAAKDVTIDPASPDLVRYWRFDDPNQIIDETGNQTPLAPPTGASLLPSTSPVGGGGNIAPLALDDSASTDPGQAVTIDVLANDSDSDGALDPATVTVVSGPTNGTHVVNADGSITYTPNTGFQGSDSLTYTVDDDEGATSAQAAVTLTVGTPNDPPVALNDSASTDPDQAVTIDVLANDSDPDGTLDPNTVTVVSAPTNGTFNVNADGSITYTPNAGFQGSETFTYTVADNLGASSAEADVTVSVGASPAGMLDTTAQSGIDIDNVTLTGAFTVESWIWFRPGESISNKDGLLRAESGNAHINFFNGQLRFASYAPGEPRGDVVVGATQLGTGSWHHVAVTRDENDILRAYVDGVLDGTATEAWTADLVVDQITQTKRGTTDGAFDEFRIWDRELDAAELTAAKDVTIDPASPDLVRYWRFDDPNQIIDETGNQTPLAPPTGASLLPSTSPVLDGGNAAPIARDDIANNSAVNAPVTIDVLANDYDLDGTLDPTSIVIVTQAMSGNAVANTDGTITYTPNNGFEGLDTLEYTVQDDGGGVSFPAEVSFSVGQGALNEPDAIDDSFITIEGAIDVPMAVLLNDTDPTNDPLSVATFTAPTNGTLRIEDGTLLYTPNAGFSGTDSFTYTATDGLWISSEPATVDISITAAVEQPQTILDPRIAPELPASGLAMVVEKVAKLPLNSSNNQPNMNTLATQGDRIFVGTEGDIANESRIFELVDDGQGGQEFVLFMDVGQAVFDATGRDLSNDNAKHGGLRSVAFHPDFEDPTSDGYGKMYTSVVEQRPTDPTGFNYLSSPPDPVDADSVLVEWTYDFTTESIDLDSYREVFRVGMFIFDHAIRQIGFDPYAEPGDEDYGLLYIGHGDGSFQSAQQGGGQNNDALGKILRVDPLQDGSEPFSVPASNPFVGDPNMLDEVYALGFRNPAHLSFAQDSSGESHLIVTTIGRDNFDEVNIVTPGGNYGWSEREGPLVHKDAGGGIVNGVEALPADDAQYGYTYPTAFIGHEGPDGAGFVGRALTGGYVIQNGSSEFDDQFIFAEFATTGRVYHADFSDMLDVTTTLDPNDPTRDDPSDLSWVTPSEVTILYDHDNDPTTTPIAKESLKDIFDDNPDFDIKLSKGLTRADVRFGQGPDGELYIMNKHDGWLYLASNTTVDEFIF
ncbi:MAG: Ig-like domain-containing protein [Pseudomonadota bacterium]